MSTRILPMLLLAAAIGPALLMTGCGDGSIDDPKSRSLTETVIDDVVESTFSAAEPDSVDVEYALGSDREAGMAAANANAERPVGPAVHDMIVKDSIIYAVIDEGILVRDLNESKNLIVPCEEPIGAIVDLGEKILVGTSSLYTLDGDVLSDEDYQLNLAGPITALHKRGIHLYIGTTSGMYELTIGGIRELAQGVCVSTITSDTYGGVWVGTTGDGLYRWDGEQFRKRYLKRDSTLFDNVTALDYRHDHLYLGTDRGFFIFDGGSWQAYSPAEGLPSEIVTSINAEDWVIRIGTSRGPVTFFNGEFELMPRLSGVTVTNMVKRDGRLLAATSNAGLLMVSGGLVTSLYDEQTKPSPLALDETQ